MKNSIGSSLVLALALGALVLTIAENPPGGVRWAVFAEDPSTLQRKLSFLFSLYIWPGLLSCFAISMFQMQARFSSGGANKRIVFSICVFASGAMLVSLRSMALSPSSGSGYVAGMALGYTMMSQLYAVRMRKVLGPIRLPWPVWRGNALAVRQIDERVRLRTGGAPSPR